MPSRAAKQWTKRTWISGRCDSYAFSIRGRESWIKESVAAGAGASTISRKTRFLPVSPFNDVVTEHQDIHFCPEKTIKRFFGTADDRLILVEGRIENHRY